MANLVSIISSNKMALYLHVRMFRMPVELPAKKCFVCEAESQYRCPTCMIRYCSVGCFKTHKESNKCKERVKNMQIGKTSRPSSCLDTPFMTPDLNPTFQPCSKVKTKRRNETLKEIEFKGEDTLSQIDLEKVREIKNLNWIVTFSRPASKLLFKVVFGQGI